MTEQTRSERFQQVVLPHLHGAYNLARWLCRNDHDAEDIVQEACLRAFRFFDGFHGEDARAWLLTIVRNTTWTWLQQNRRHELSTPFDEQFHGPEEGASVTILNQPDSNPESILAREDDRGLVNRALEMLPLEFREVLVLREMEDLSYREISEIASIPMGTVMSRLARARRLLGEHLRRMVKESRGGLQRNQGPAARPRG
ncbi:MAG: sigma-70 family RNA polymerase sigma factor [Burkholderiales bacterium]